MSVASEEYEYEEYSADEDLFDEEDDLEDFWDAPNAPDAW